VTEFDHVILKPLELVFGMTLEEFGDTWATEALECYMQSLMDDSGRHSEHQNGKRNADSAGHAHEV
jgi:hypothetical protein